jgi:hypothetical protein
LDIEGVQVLLDLIEVCEYSLKRLALSCLCSLLENKKSFQSFVEWNSQKSSLNATQLLIQLYEQENKRFGVDVTDGILRNIERPLFPKLSYLIQKYANEEEITELAQNKSLSAVQQSSHNMSETSLQKSVNDVQSRRSKASRILRMALAAASKISSSSQFNEAYISSVLADLVKTYDLRSTLFATFYRVGFDLHELTNAEKQTMEMITLYPFLKNGEIWRDIKEELEDTDVKPTGDDEHWLKTCIEESEEQIQQAVYNQTRQKGEMRTKAQEEIENYFSAIRLKSQIKGLSGNQNNHKRSQASNK